LSHTNEITVQIPVMVFNWIQEEATKRHITPEEFASQILSQELARQIYKS
jgi:hypothetical protein